MMTIMHNEQQAATAAAEAKVHLQQHMATTRVFAHTHTPKFYCSHYHSYIIMI
jgi:hypothetical protein